MNNDFRNLRITDIKQTISKSYKSIELFQKLKRFWYLIACCQARARSSTPNNGVGGHGEVLNGAVETIKEEEEEEEVEENGHVGNGV